MITRQYSILLVQLLGLLPSLHDKGKNSLLVNASPDMDDMQEDTVAVARELLQNDGKLTAFMDLQQEQEIRNLQQGDDESTTKEPRTFGQRCGNYNTCEAPLDCIPINAMMGNRCLPNSCLQQQRLAFKDTFDMTQFKDILYNAAGLSEDQFLNTLSVATSEREFLQSTEWLSMQRALHENMAGPIEALQQMSRNCNISRQDSETVEYVGYHLEGGFLLDASLNYLALVRGVDQRSIIRTCLGAELGAGAEIDFILGFSDAVLTKDFVCGSIFADVDAALIGAAGVSTGVTLNGNFFYEFTLGGGLGAGLGGGACFGFPYGIVNSTDTPP